MSAGSRNGDEGGRKKSRAAGGDGAQRGAKLSAGDPTWAKKSKKRPWAQREFDLARDFFIR